MNGKNIKKSLNAKLQNWIDSVDDENVRKIISNNTIITGGAIVSMLNKEAINDYDVYFKTREATLTVTEYYIRKFNEAHGSEITIIEETDEHYNLVPNGKIKIFISNSGVAKEDKETEIVTDESEPIEKPHDKESEIGEKPKFRPIYITSNAITLSDKIQIVIRFWGEVEEIHKNYDFAHCTCAWSSWDNNLSLPSNALECIINKELRYMGSKYPLCSMIRSRKFISRGYTINSGQYLKMALQLNELDLRDIAVLEDQLVGVDSAYFHMLISAIVEKKEKDPEWKMENSYLFELINRIF